MNQPLEKVTVRAPADWIKIRAVDDGFKPSELGHLTVLLSDNQYHAEQHAHYRRLVQRLETQQAVQQVSQYRLDYDPATQDVTVHSITVVRGTQRVEQANLDRFRLLQREESLEAFVIHGWLTLLLLLDDVRVGDVIDASYTVRTIPKLLPEKFCAFSVIPQGFSIRAFHLDVHFASQRPMQWRSSAKELQPAIQQTGAETHWSWTHENQIETLSEPNLPKWFLDGTWIQVTDCESWTAVTTACLKSWPLAEPAPEVQQLAGTLAADAPSDEERAERAIRYVQDEFRYLSVNTTLGGQIPSPPTDVLRRRFGDCKDLSGMLVVLLRELGIPARPVLVNTVLEQRVRDLLPMPSAFNHCIVEYELGTERRWVDATRRLQGGSKTARHLSNFGAGLAIDTGTAELSPMPTNLGSHGVHHLRETFLLNTTGPKSILDVVVVATGAEAETLRNQFANHPERWIAEHREQLCAQLFPQVARIGRIEHRDDRAKNEFKLAERYEISNFLRPANHPGSCYFLYGSHPLNHILLQPLKPQRKHPLAVVYPFRCQHTVEIEFPDLPAWNHSPSRKANSVFTFERHWRRVYGFNTVTYSLETLVDNIHPVRFPKIRKDLDDVWAQTLLFLELPLGVRGRTPRLLTDKL